MKAILRTGNRTAEYLMERSKQDPQQMDLSLEEAKTVKAYLDAFDGCEVVLSDDGPHHFLIGWVGDADNTEKVKEALYLMQQDPMFGTYIDVREEFEHDWDEGEFQTDAGISFREDEFEILEETPKERFKRLLRTHPGIKVINEIDEPGTGVFNAEVADCHVKDYVYQDGRYIFKDMARTFVDGLCWEVQGGYEEQEKARKAAWDIVKGLKWQRAIFLRFETEA